jgi:aspartate/methionine/tyrosine aminotransferase
MMQQKLKLLQPSASMEITRLAKKIEAEGVKVYPLSIGDTHFAPPEAIQKKYAEAIEKGHTHYGESMGLPELRQKIASYYPSGFHPDQVLITPGVKQGLYYLFLASDFKRVCVLEPAWLGYEATAILTGKEYIPVNIKEADWKKKISAIQFDALLICSPNNPDGKVFTRSELEFLKDLADKNKALLLIDEIYRNYIFDSKNNELEFLYKLPNVIILNGFSKSHAMTGYRIGYLITSDKSLMASCNKLQQNIATCTSTVAQYSATSFVEGLGEVERYSAYYKTNRDLVSEIIPELEQFKPQGAFYYFVNLNVFKIKDAVRFCKLLLEKEKIALVPGDAYGKDFTSWVRISFSINKEDLEAAMKKMKNFIKEYSE